MQRSIYLIENDLFLSVYYLRANVHSTLELINFLTSVDDTEADVVIAYFQTNGTAELFDIEEVEVSDGMAQLKISEAE